MVEIPGGVYPIGDDEPILYFGHEDHSHMPPHEVLVGSFAIGRFAVTTEEWACFISADGYDDERWWETADARAWQRGEATMVGRRENVKYWRRWYKDHPEQLEATFAAGQFTEEIYERWRRRSAMTEAELDAHLRELYPGGRETEPQRWRDARHRNGAQPVIGICWYEARAYCAWLSAQTGSAYRLPSEVEWESAARGLAGRRYAYGDAFDTMRASTMETRLKRPVPVGVFMEGDTPEAVTDLSGNIGAWTTSLWGEHSAIATFRYPYDVMDGRESLAASATCRRVVRGGNWYHPRDRARATYRYGVLPDYRADTIGMRLAQGSTNQDQEGV